MKSARVGAIVGLALAISQNLACGDLPFGGTPCPTVDDTSSEGLLTADLEPFSTAVPAERGFAKTQARITNVSSDTIVIIGEGGLQFYGYLTTQEGDVLSAPPEDVNATEKLSVELR